MGLRARIDLCEWGFPTRTSILHIPIDYSQVIEMCGEASCEIAKSICPVDTGYLQSSIDWKMDKTRWTIEATAEYAQYVEYGTWKMRAQPYFTPAVEQSAQVAFALASQIYAQALLEEELTLYGESDFSGDLFGEAMAMSSLEQAMKRPAKDSLYGGIQQIVHGIAFNRDGSIGAGIHGYYQLNADMWRKDTMMYKTAIENQQHLGEYRAEAMRRFAHDDALRSKMIRGGNLSAGLGRGYSSGVSSFGYGVGMYAMSSIGLSTGSFMTGLLGGLLAGGIATLIGLVLSDIFGPQQPEYKSPQIIII